MAVPMEIRFSSLMHMVRPPSHYHTATGEFHEGDPTGGVDAFSARMSAEDHAALNAVNEKLEAIQEDGTKMMSQTRFTGGRPDIKQVQALNQRRTEALKSGLASLQSKLSPEGWAMVDQFLREMNTHAAGMAGPRGWPARGRS